MYLPLETLLSAINNVYLIQVEMIDLVNFVIIFPFLNTLFHILNFPTRISVSDSHSLALLNFYLPLNPKTCSAATCSPLVNSVHAVA